MARIKDREKALSLRKQEMSYSQIKSKLKISKSTLSGWLKDYPLPPARIKELQHGEKRIEKYRATMKKKREARLQKFFNEQKKLIFPFSKRELYLAGIFLYWGEGTKLQLTRLLVANTDPAIINFFLFWLVKSLGVPKTMVRIQLQLYSDMNIEKEIDFWSKALNITKQQFTRPYIKKSLSTRINHQGGFGHGTCGIRLGNARLAERTMMTIKAITEKYNKLRV
ncbi:MAG: helix-turn-helix domain-containing protein [bacterium]|nr:helix-turn-helix domain-containing protein [bacterium]